jgi:hypothetical protein
MILPCSRSICYLLAEDGPNMKSFLMSPRNRAPETGHQQRGGHALPRRRPPECKMLIGRMT